MGNVLESAAGDGDIQAEDLKWLITNNDSLFNNAYLTEVNESLSKFSTTGTGSTNGSITTKNDDVDISLKYPVNPKALHLLEIFSKSCGDLLTVESIPELQVGDAICKNSFHNVLESRSRVLKRIHLVSYKL